MRHIGWLWRPLVYLWSFPTTAIGLVIALAGRLTGGRLYWVMGVLEAHGGLASLFARSLGASAVTLGHVVVALDAQALASTRVHERVHVRQCERWGPFFLPAYFLCRWWVGLRGGDPYRDNPFEKQAFDEERQWYATRRGETEGPILDG